jgi:hypothetical protein
MSENREPESEPAPEDGEKQQPESPSAPGDSAEEAKQRELEEAREIMDGLKREYFWGI